MADPKDRNVSPREQRSFQGDMGRAADAERPAPADSGDPASGGDVDRDVADLREAEGDLGAGTPANVDLHKLGQADNPEEDWGEPADPQATFSSNHSRRAEKTEAERGQGAKTRQANKDIVSRRG